MDFYVVQHGFWPRMANTRLCGMAHLPLVWPFFPPFPPWQFYHVRDFITVIVLSLYSSILAAIPFLSSPSPFLPSMRLWTNGSVSEGDSVDMNYWNPQFWLIPLFISFVISGGSLRVHFRRMRRREVGQYLYPAICHHFQCRVSGIACLRLCSLGKSANSTAEGPPDWKTRICLKRHTWIYERVITCDGVVVKLM